MKFSIKGQKTLNGSEDLCKTCQASRITIINNQEERLCLTNYYFPVKMEGRVQACSRYNKVGEPSLYNLEKIAWDFEVSRKEVGFGGGMDVKVIRPSERKRD